MDTFDTQETTITDDQSDRTSSKHTDEDTNSPALTPGRFAGLKATSLEWFRAFRSIFPIYIGVHLAFLVACISIIGILSGVGAHADSR